MSTPVRFIFFGTPTVAVWVLEELAAAGFRPLAVVTAPDRRAGRGMQRSAPAAKRWAEAAGIPVLQPAKLDAAFQEELRAYGADVFLVAAYGKILKPAVLALAPRGCLNVHPSLLPKYRGPAPIESQILADDARVGVSLMLLDEEMDHGPLLAQEEVPQPAWPAMRSVLAESLSRAGGRLAALHMPTWIAGTQDPAPQDDAAATYTRKIEKDDGRIALDAPGRENYLKYCAYEGWPGVYFYAEKEGRRIRVKIARARLDGAAFVPERIVPEGKAEQDFSWLAQAGWTPA